MTNSGFVQILHDLLRHPSFISAPPAYRCVLITIIDRACYSPCQQDDHGRLIDLKPGQFVCTIRKLSELANVGRKDVEHAIARFSQIGILGQEVRHTKSIFTILWGVKIQNTGTRIGTTLGQVRDRKEDIKEEKKINNKEHQQHPSKSDDDDVWKKKALKRLAFISEAFKIFPCFDEVFLAGLIRKYSLKSVTSAVDEFTKSNQDKINNPKGFLTDRTKTFYLEEQDASKLANK